MARQSNTFRIFVSSTFSDLKAERSALQEKVFPRLRELCQAHGARFQAIDLRWGVSEEASLDQQTMNICLSEIARCQRTTPRPNFIVLLGDRYGWCPPPPQIQASEFEAILKRVTREDRKFLEAWYRRDENAVPPEFVLQPRERGGQYEVYDDWAPVERRLHEILASVVEGMALDEGKRLKYLASATHQEIDAGALKVQDAPEHVFCFFREIEGLPQDTTAKGYIDLDADGRLDEDAAQKLAELKSSLESLLQENVYHYSADWLGEGITTAHIGVLPSELAGCMPMLEDGYSPKNLCEAVWCSLARVIQKELSLLESVDPLQAEIDAHATFAHDRARVFVGRTDPLAKIATYLTGSDNHPLVVWGETGCGKSAFMARAIQQAIENHPTAEVIYRFIGATPDSPNTRVLLENLFQQITDVYGGDEENIPPIEDNKLVRGFFALIDKFFSNLYKPGSPRKRLVIFIDALDQLSQSDDAHFLDWIPEKLPGAVRLVVSTLPGESKQKLESRLSGQNLVELPPMSPDQGSELLDIWLMESGRSLRPNQRKSVLSGFSKNGLPLYLKLAFEEARLWKSYSPDLSLSPDVPGVIRALFTWLSSEASHGGVLISHALGYLAATRDGLSEDEMLDMLSRDEEVIADFLRRSPKSPKFERLPVVVWSRLYFDLKPFLVECSVYGASLLGFFHRQMAEIAEELYLSGNVKVIRHQELAKYFASQAQFKEVDDVNSANRHAVFELPYQQTLAEMWPELEATLTNILFIAAKCSAGLSFDLVRDYELVGAYRQIRTSRLTLGSTSIVSEQRHPSLIQQSLPPAHKGAEVKSGPPSSKRFRDFAGFMADQAKNLSLHPELTFQQALLFPRDSSVFLAAEKLWQSGGYHQPRLVWINKLDHREPRIGTYFGPEGINACAFSPNGKHLAAIFNSIYIWDQDRPNPLVTIDLEGVSEDCRFSPDGRMIAAPTGTSLSIWDVDSGTLITRFAGHPDNVLACAFSPDGKRIVSASLDGTLKVWEVNSHRELFTLRGHKGIVFDCDYSPDGKQIVSASFDNTLRIWDAVNGSLIANLTGHTKRVSKCKFSSDGQFILSTSDDQTVRIWDAYRGKEIRTLSGHQYPVDDCSFSPEGRYVVSIDHHSCIKVWDPRSGNELSTYYSHAGHLVSDFSCAYSPDGKMLISGSSSDAALNIWDVEGLLTQSGVPRHQASVTRCVFSPNGQRVASSSYDKTIKLWDITCGAQIATLSGHTSGVLDCAFTPDNQRLVSASLDSTLKYWDVNRGVLFSTFEGHTQAVRALAISPDGRRLLSGSDDHTIILWDLINGAKIHQLEAHQEAIQGCAFDPTGLLAVSGSYDGGFKLWIIERGVKLVEGRGHAPHVDACSFSPDGRRIATGFESKYKHDPREKKDRSLELWDTTQTGTRVADLSEGSRGINASGVSPDGRIIYTACGNGTIKVWDANTGILLDTLSRHTDAVTDCSLSPDGQLLVSSSDDATLRLWDAKKGIEIGPLGSELDERFLKGVHIGIFSSDSKRIAVGAYNGMVHIFNVESGAKIFTCNGGEVLRACAFSPDGSTITLVSDNNTITTWNIDKGDLISRHEGDLKTKEMRSQLKNLHEQQVRRQLGLPSKPKSPIFPGSPLTGQVQELVQQLGMGAEIAKITACAGAISHDNQQIVLGYQDGRLELRDTKRHTFKRFAGHCQAVSACAISIDGRWMASASIDGALKVWDTEQGIAISTPSGHEARINACAFSYDGRWVVSASDDKTLKIWETAGGKQRITLSGHLDSVMDCACSPDGCHVVSASKDNTIRIWEADTGVELKRITSQWGAYHTCSYSPDGRKIFAATKGYLLAIWDTFSGDQLVQLGGHQKAVKACSFSSDGHRIISASIDDTIRIWDVDRKALIQTISIYDANTVRFSPSGDWFIVATGKSLEVWDAHDYVKIATLEGHTGRIDACDVSPDGKMVVTASSDRSLKLWDTNNWSEIRSLIGHERGVRTCAFTLDGQRIVSASYDGTIRQWDIRFGVQKSLMTGGHHGRIKSCFYSPDGNSIISASDDGSIVIWDAEQSNKVYRFGSSYAANTGIYDFSPDGKTIAATLSDQTIKIWNINTGAAVKQLGEAQGIGFGCNYSPDGNFILSHRGSWLRIWDVCQDNQVASLIVKSGITSYNWSPVGSTLVVGDDLGNIYLFKLEGANLDAPWVTAWYSSKSNSHAFGCPWCYRWSPIPESAPGTTIFCPECGGLVRLNSTTISSDWTRISAAWSGSSDQGLGDADELELQEFIGQRAEYLYKQGYIDSALRIFRIREKICREKNYPYGLQASLGYQAMILKDRNELTAALKLLTEQRDICKENKFMEWLQWSLDYEALIFYERGDLERALPLYKEHAEICRVRDDKFAQQFSIGRQGFILYKLGDFDHALPLFIERENLCRKIGEKSGLQSSLCNQGIIYHERGNFAEALKCYKEHENICRELGDMHGLSISLGNQGEALQAMGDLDGAMKLYKEQERLCREQNNQDHLQWSLGNQASIYEARRDIVGTQTSKPIQEAAQAVSPRWRDEFDSATLDPLWYWVNENSSMWSLRKHPGFLRIDTSPGKTGSQNLLLRPVEPGDFVIRTHLFFQPNSNFQFAGLVIYQDQNNFLQFGRAFCKVPDVPVGNGLYFDYIRDGGWVNGNFATTTKSSNEAHLRLGRKGNNFWASYSEDGVNWRRVGTHEVRAGFIVNGIGLTASQSFSGEAVPADFDYFELEQVK